MDLIQLEADNDELGPDQAGREFEPHRTDDPDVWGLADINRKPAVPTTIYNRSGDSVSGVVGLLYPDGTFLKAAPSRVGQEVTLTQDGETFTVMTVWDGALVKKGEYSKGVLLGDYEIKVVGSRRLNVIHGEARGRKDGSAA